MGKKIRFASLLNKDVIDIVEVFEMIRKKGEKRVGVVNFFLCFKVEKKLFYFIRIFYFVCLYL